MAHEIMGQRFIARSKPGWHNIAKRIFGEDERLTASEAMAEVAGDIEFDQQPIYYAQGETMVAIKGKTAILRKPTFDDAEWKLMGITTDGWVKATYAQLAKALDGLAGKYKVETAGLLKDGGLAFLCFRDDDWDVRGDVMRSYFAANFSLTPGIGHRLFHSPVRLECWNTNTMAKEQATINLSIPHATDALQRIELAAQLVSQFTEMKDKAKGIFEAFADRHISMKEADTIFAAAFALPSLPAKLRLLKQQLSETEAEVFKRALTPDLLQGLERTQSNYDRDCEGILTLRKVCQERFDAFEPKNLGGTVWAAYNAVTEVSDWREGKGADESLLIGGRAQEKSRAYEAAYALIGR